YVRKNRQFSFLVERPPVNIFSISDVFSVGYSLFPSLQELRSFVRKTGIFFDISGALETITGRQASTDRGISNCGPAACSADPFARTQNCAVSAQRALIRGRNFGCRRLLIPFH